MPALNKSVNEFKGKIIIADYCTTVLDGASEWESKGLIDLYDMPPIDTWFYETGNKYGRKDLYAWIPEPFTELAQNAIDVNVLNNINWCEF